MDHCWRGRVGRFRFGYLTVVILMRLCSQKRIANCGFRIGLVQTSIPQSEIRNPKFGLVDLARFERATSTFAESRSNSPELQVLRLPIAESGLRRSPRESGDNPHFLNPQSAIGWRRRQDLNLQATLRGDLANRCHTIRRRLQKVFGKKVGGRDRTRTCKRQTRGSFRDYCLTS